MTLDDFKNGVVKHIWNEDDNTFVLVVDTPEFGLQGLRAEDLTTLGEEDDE